MCLTPEELADRYEWFHANHALFLWTDEQLQAARKPFALYDLPEGAGVYFLFHEGQLAYVGQSNQLPRRLKRHAYPQGKCGPRVTWLTHYAVIPAPTEFLDTVENYFINLCEPPLNKSYRPLCPDAARYLVLNDE